MNDSDHYKKTRDFHRTSAIERLGFYDARDGKPLKHSKWQHRIRQQVLIYLARIIPKENEPLSLVDIGCGKGDFTLEIHKAFPELSSITGTDFTPEVLGLALEASRGIDSVKFLEADLLNLPIPDQHHDITVCINVLHHILESDSSKALAELARTTHKHLILEIKNVDNFYYRHIAPKTFAGIQVYPTSVPLICRELKEHGFKLVYSRGVFFLNSPSPLVVLAFERQA